MNVRPSTWSHCRSCGARIYWVVTEGGAAMPVDADPVPGGNVVIRRHGIRYVGHVLRRDESPPPGVERRMPHHATCPDGAAWKGAHR